MVEYLKSDILWCIVFSVARSFILENTGAAITRESATEYDYEKLKQMRKIWREPSLWLIGLISSLSFFCIIPYLIYRDGFIVSLLEFAGMIVGTHLGMFAYRNNSINNSLLRFISPFIWVASMITILT